MRAENSGEVALTRDFDSRRRLSDVHTIEIRNETKVFERRRGLGWKLKTLTDDTINFFGDGLVGTGKSKIINLTEE